MPHRTRIPMGWLVIVGSLTATAGSAIDLCLPAMPQMSDDLGVPIATVELTMTFLLVGLAVGQLIAGPISDARGRRPVLAFGLTAFTIGNVLCAVAPGIQLLLTARLLTGLAGGAMLVIGTAVIRDHYSGVQAARAFSLVIIASGIAPMLAPDAGALLLHVTTWRGTFLVLAAMGLIVLACTRRFLPESLAPEHRNDDGFSRTLRDLRVLITDRTYVLYALIMTLSYACMFTYVSNSSPVLQDTYGMEPTGYALVFGINALGLVVLSQIGGRLVHRVGSRRLLLIGIALATLGSVGVLLSQALAWPAWAIIVSFGITISTFGLISPNSMAMALTNQADRAGSASAIVGASRFAAGGIFAPIAALALSAFDWGTGLVMLSLSTLSLALFVVGALTLRRVRARSQ